MVSVIKQAILPYTLLVAANIVKLEDNSGNKCVKNAKNSL